jgi:hypothetical protein
MTARDLLDIINSSSGCQRLPPRADLLLHSFALSCRRHLFAPVQVRSHILRFHRQKPIHHDDVMRVDGIASAAPPTALLPRSVIFIGIDLISSALVICVRCLHRPKHALPPLQDILHCNAKMAHHCASVYGIKERRRWPRGHVGRNAEYRARASGEPLQRPIKDVVCERFLRWVCIWKDISRVHCKIRCLLRETISLTMCSIGLNRRTLKNATSRPNIRCRFTMRNRPFRRSLMSRTMSLSPPESRHR